MVFKSLNNLAPENLGSKFTSRSLTTPYTFRDSENKLAIPLPRTNYLRNSFNYSGAVLRNSLPQNLRQAKSEEFQKTFKQTLQEKMRRHSRKTLFSIVISMAISYLENI